MCDTESPLQGRRRTAFEHGTGYKTAGCVSPTAVVDKSWWIETSLYRRWSTHWTAAALIVRYHPIRVQLFKSCNRYSWTARVLPRPWSNSPWTLPVKNRISQHQPRPGPRLRKNGQKQINTGVWQEPRLIDRRTRYRERYFFRTERWGPVALVRSNRRDYCRVYILKLPRFDSFLNVQNKFQQNFNTFYHDKWSLYFF